jgi:hypothetical protein
MHVRLAFPAGPVSDVLDGWRESLAELIADDEIEDFSLGLAYSKH